MMKKEKKCEHNWKFIEKKSFSFVGPPFGRIWVEYQFYCEKCLERKTEIDNPKGKEIHQQLLSLMSNGFK